MITAATGNLSGQDVRINDWFFIGFFKLAKAHRTRKMLSKKLPGFNPQKFGYII
jgi:hypothetical protein